MPHAVHTRVRSHDVAVPLWRALAAADAPVSVQDLHVATAANPTSIVLRLGRWERAGLITGTKGVPLQYQAAATSPPSRVAASALWSNLTAASTPITIAALRDATGRNKTSILMQLRRWVRAGLVTESSNEPRRYRMTADTSTPPNVSPNGTIRNTPAAYQRLWTTMRVLKRFDLPTIIMTASCSRKLAEDYLRALGRAGYVRQLSAGRASVGEWASYMLVRRSGPTAPRIVRKSRPGGPVLCELVDRNDGSRHDVGGSAKLDAASASPSADVCVG